MKTVRIDQSDPHVVSAIADLKDLIGNYYPEATFDLSEGDDPEGLYLTANVDVENIFDVLDIAIDRLVEIQIDQGLPIYLLVGLPPHRVEERLQAMKSYTAEAKERVNS